MVADEAMRLDPTFSLLGLQLRDRRRAKEFSAPTTFEALSSAVVHLGARYEDLEWGFVVTLSRMRGGRISGTRPPVRVWAQTRGKHR